MKGKYLSEVVDINDLQEGKLNIIDAPCGSGKTTLVEKKLWREAYWGDMLYLIDTKNGLDAFKSRGEQREYKGEIYYKHKGITAMTYATFAMLCIYKPDEWLWNDEDALIVCDEMQSVIKWAKIPQDVNLHKVALEQIHNRIALGTRVVAISATTNKIKEEFKNEYVMMPIHGELIRYEVNNKIKYQNIQNIINILPADKKGLIYVPHITSMIDLQKQLEVRSIKCAKIFSMSNENYHMDENDLRARKSILEQECIPNDIQVLIINAATETGINIKSDVDYVVINSTDEDTVIQVIGRIRHDVDTVYYLEKNRNGTVYISYEQIKDWLNKSLTTDDKNNLCAYIDARDNRNRLLGWTNIKKSLVASGYEVIEKKNDSTRYTVIR